MAASRYSHNRWVTLVIFLFLSCQLLVTPAKAVDGLHLAGSNPHDADTIHMNLSPLATVLDDTGDEFSDHRAISLRISVPDGKKVISGTCQLKFERGWSIGTMFTFSLPSDTFTRTRGHTIIVGQGNADAEHSEDFSVISFDLVDLGLTSLEEDLLLNVRITNTNGPNGYDNILLNVYGGITIIEIRDGGSEPPINLVARETFSMFDQETICDIDSIHIVPPIYNPIVHAAIDELINQEGEPQIPIGFSEESLELEFKVYPNPASQSLKVFNPTTQSIKITIATLNGQTTFEGTIEGQETITVNVSNYEAAVYLLILSSNNKHFKQRIVIAR